MVLLYLNADLLFPVTGKGLPDLHTQADRRNPTQYQVEGIGESEIKAIVESTIAPCNEVNQLSIIISYQISYLSIM